MLVELVVMLVVLFAAVRLAVVAVGDSHVAGL